MMTWATQPVIHQSISAPSVQEQGSEPGATNAAVACLRLQGASPQEILMWALDTFGSGLTIGTGFGVSGMALIDMALRLQPDADIFYIDTDFFFPETLALVEEAQRYFGRTFRRISPELSVEEQEARYGPRLYHHNPNLCCHLRKVKPLQEALRGRTAWVTALRRDQSPSRAQTPVVRWNQRYGLAKVSPLAGWTEDEVWHYVRANRVPYNELLNRDYGSVGCWPCTRAVQPGESPRAGRWPATDKTECGLHWVR
jgi:phosphoadenosine phosphosulfate reductase